MWMRTISLVLLVGACSSGSEEVENTVAESTAAESAAPAAAETDCNALAVVVDGEPVAMPHGLAVRGDEDLAVHLFNDDAVTCEQVLQGFWPSPPGQVHVVARHRLEGSHYASTDNRTTTAEVRVLSEEEGQVSLCVDEPVEFARRIGKPTVTLQGRFEGRLCSR